MVIPFSKSLSLDDLSYYHSYDDYGYAAKLIIDENGIIQYIFTDNPLAQYEDLTKAIQKIQ